MAVQYGWLAGWFPFEVLEDDQPIAPGAMPSPVLVIVMIAGELWYLTPVLWVLTIVLGLLAPGSRTARVAMGLATLSLFAFGFLITAFPRP